MKKTSRSAVSLVLALAMLVVPYIPAFTSLAQAEEAVPLVEVATLVEKAPTPVIEEVAQEAAEAIVEETPDQEGVIESTQEQEVTKVTKEVLAPQEELGMAIEEVAVEVPVIKEVSEASVSSSGGSSSARGTDTEIGTARVCKLIMVNGEPVYAGELDALMPYFANTSFSALSIRDGRANDGSADKIVDLSVSTPFSFNDTIIGAEGAEYDVICSAERTVELTEDNGFAVDVWYGDAAGGPEAITGDVADLWDAPRYHDNYKGLGLFDPVDAVEFDTYLFDDMTTSVGDPCLESGSTATNARHCYADGHMPIEAGDKQNRTLIVINNFNLDFGGIVDRGTLRFCKVMLDAEGNIITNDTRDLLDGKVPTGAGEGLGIEVGYEIPQLWSQSFLFDFPYRLNSDIVEPDSAAVIEDAHCTYARNVPLGTYRYSKEFEVLANGTDSYAKYWKEGRYYDNFESGVTTPSMFELYGDGQYADGYVELTENGQEVTIVVANQLKVEPDDDSGNNGGSGGSGNGGNPDDDEGTITTGGFSGGGSGGSGNGQVLGAAISAEDLAVECPVFTKYLWATKKVAHDASEVRLWQRFLNEYMGADLAVDGIYGPKTINAVKTFQEMHRGYILDVWEKGYEVTGNVYKTTMYQANRIVGCPGEQVWIECQEMWYTNDYSGPEFIFATTDPSAA